MITESQNKLNCKGPTRCPLQECHSPAHTCCAARWHGGWRLCHSQASPWPWPWAAPALPRCQGQERGHCPREAPTAQGRSPVSERRVAMPMALQDYPFVLQLFLVQTYGEEITWIGLKWLCGSTLGSDSHSDADVKLLGPRKTHFRNSTAEAWSRSRG